MELDALLDQFVADHQSRQFPALTARHAHIEAVPGKIDVVIGPRRAGKTWLLFDTLARLERAGVPRTQTLYVQFEDERLAPLQATDMQGFLDAFYRRHPAASQAEVWLLFDEIQNVAGWEKFVRRLAEDPRYHLVLTGSSAKLLASEIATSLRGRSLTTELLPFSFAEALSHQGILAPSALPPDSAQRAQMEHAFLHYLDTGGYPEVQHLDASLRRRILQEYVDVALYRDVIERHEVHNTVALRQLMRRLLRSLAQKFSVHRIAQDMASQGVKVGKDTLHEYLQHLEDAFLVMPLALHDRSERRRAVHPRKCYLADHALAGVASLPQTFDRGAVLENLVYLGLRRQGADVAYHVTAHGYELDFVVRDGGEVTRLIQVCATLGEPQTKAREMRALQEAMAETGARVATIVTMFESGRERVGDVDVQVVPAWRFLL